MSFRITGLSADPFRHLYGLSDQELALHGVKRYIADKRPGFPDRIEMRDASVGEKLLLLNHVYQPTNTPYRGTDAIFVCESFPKARRSHSLTRSCMTKRRAVPIRKDG